MIYLNFFLIFILILTVVIIALFEILKSFNFGQIGDYQFLK